MANFNFATMASQLDATEEDGVEFQDKALTWNTAEDVKDVVEALNNKKNCIYLKLDGNTLGVEAAQAIAEALKRHPEFRKALWKNMFTRRLKTEIPQALKHLGNGLIGAGARLTVLDLSDNALGPNGMTGLEQFLRSPVCYTLQELYLNNCGLGPEGGRMLSEALLSLHSNAKEAGSPLQMRVFVAGRNRLENAGAEAIAEIFKTLKTLEEIVMPQNSIYHHGVAALAEGFKENPHLRVLNLNDNTLNVKGASKIADVLGFLPLLRELNLGDCLIKTNGAYQFADVLEQNHEHLEILDLGFNDINSDGGQALVTAILNKPKLKVLNLNGNYFGQECRDWIVETMAGSTNPAALQPLDEDNSENEAEDDESDQLDDDDQVGEDYDGEYTDNDEEEDDDEYDEQHDHANDTTEEADEEDQDYGADETAYVTTNPYTTKLFNDTVSSTKGNISETFVSVDCSIKPNACNNRSDTFAIVDNDNKTNTCNAEQFCLSQTPCTLQQFEAFDTDNKLQSLQNIINQFTGDDHLLLLVFTTLKCAHLSQTSKPALDLAISLYQATFDYAVKTKQESRVLDYYLKQLGLLRSEEPFKSDYDMKSCRYALRQALSQQEFANDNVKNTFKLFLEKLDV